MVVAHDLGGSEDPPRIMGPAVHLSTASRRLVIVAAACAIVMSMLVPLASRGQIGGDQAGRTVSATIAALDAHERASVAVHAFAGVKLVARTAPRRMAAGVLLAILAALGLLGTIRRRWRAIEVPAPVVGLTSAGQGSRAPPVVASLR